MHLNLGGVGPRCRSVALVTLFALGGGSVCISPAMAQIAEDQAAARIEKEYDVKVLRVRPGEVDDVPVWMITVMQQGGNYNTAFQVTTLAMNRANGELVSSFHQGTHGAVGNASPTDTQIDRQPDAARSGTWR